MRSRMTDTRSTARRGLLFTGGATLLARVVDLPSIVIINSQLTKA